jgi:hypothetical protein
MMVVVRASPNAAGAEDQYSKDPHQPFRQPGMGQYGLMLLIVIDHEEPEIKQSSKKTARKLAGEMEVPECPRQGH